MTHVLVHPLGTPRAQRWSYPIRSGFTPQNQGDIMTEWTGEWWHAPLFTRWTHCLPNVGPHPSSQSLHPGIISTTRGKGPVNGGSRRCSPVLHTACPTLVHITASGRNIQSIQTQQVQVLKWHNHVTQLTFPPSRAISHCKHFATPGLF